MTAQPTARAAPAAHTQAVRLFGYDVFISFALGPAPRGTQSYASDLARRLREQDFAVFFSDDQAPPGLQLDRTLQSALLRSRALVVVANRATLQDPRWVRTEVEAFRQRHPDRPVVPISVDGALRDADLSAAVQPWLGHADKIWIDESADAVATGIASDAVVQRLATTPKFRNANARWRWTVRVAFSVLAVLALGLAVATWRAVQANSQLQIALQRATLLRLGEGALAMLSGQLAGTDERTLQQLVAAHRLLPEADADRWVLAGLVAREPMQRLLPTAAGLRVARDWSHPRYVALSADGSRFALIADGSLGLWDSAAAAPTGVTIAVAGDPVVSAALSPDGRWLASGHASGVVRRWNAQSGTPLGVPWPLESAAATEAGVAAVAFSGDGRWLAAAGEQGVRVWQADNGRPAGPPLVLPAPSVRSGVTRVAVDNQGRRVATGHLSGLLHLFDLPSGALLDPSEGAGGHSAPVNALAFSPDGRLLASAGEDGVALVLASDGGGALVAQLSGHRAGVTQVAFSPDGQRLLTASSDQTLRVWDTEGWALAAAPFQGHKDVVHAAAFSPDGRRIVSVGADDTVRWWDGQADVAERRRGAPRWLVPAATAADGARSVSAGGRDGSALQRWNADGTPLGALLPAQQGSLRAVAFSPDGRYIGSAGDDGSIRLWDAATGAPVGEAWRGHTGAVRGVAFSADGTRLASGGDDGTVRLWVVPGGAADGAPLDATARAGAAAVNSVAFSPDGRGLVSGGEQDQVRLWSLQARGAPAAALAGPLANVTHVGFSPDGTRIAAVAVEAATAGQDSIGRATLRFWDSASRAPLGGPWAGNETAAQNFAFSPDGRYLVASGVERAPLAHPQDPNGQPTLRVWDARSGAFIGARPVDGIDRMFSTLFSPDGRRLAVGTRAGRLQWRAAPKAWADELCTKLTRNMSTSQWRDWVSPEIAYAVQCPGLPIAPDGTSAAPASTPASR